MANANGVQMSGLNGVNGANGTVGNYGESDLRRRIEILEGKMAGSAVSTKGRGDIETGAGGMGTNTEVVELWRVMAEGHQYKVANPAPLGLYAFGLTTALLQGYNTKWTEAGTDFLVYTYALFFGGLVQLLAGMWDIWRNNTLAGTALSSYGGFWLGYGLYGILASAGVLGGPTSEPHGLQMLLILWGCLTFIFMMQCFAVNIALLVLFLFLTLTFFLLAAGVDHPKVNKAGGYFGVATAAIAWYIATADLTNTVYRRKLLPLGILNLATKEPSMTGIARPDTL